MSPLGLKDLSPKEKFIIFFIKSQSFLLIFDENIAFKAIIVKNPKVKLAIEYGSGTGTPFIAIIPPVTVPFIDAVPI